MIQCFTFYDVYLTLTAETWSTIVFVYCIGGILGEYDIIRMTFVFSIFDWRAFQSYIFMGDDVP